MPQDVTLRFSETALIGPLVIRHYSANEARDHGAPDSLLFHPGKMPADAFADCVRNVAQSLSYTPDHINLRPEEVDRRQMFVSFPMADGHDRWDYPNRRNSHTLYGGSDYLGLDSIRRDDAATVADKALRHLRAMGLICNNDYAGALQQMTQAGLEPRVYTGSFGRADTQSLPQDFRVAAGYGLSMKAHQFIAAAHPPRRADGRIPTARFSYGKNGFTARAT